MKTSFDDSFVEIDKRYSAKRFLRAGFIGAVFGLIVGVLFGFCLGELLDNFFGFSKFMLFVIDVFFVSVFGGIGCGLGQIVGMKHLLG